MEKARRIYSWKVTLKKKKITPKPKANIKKKERKKGVGKETEAVILIILSLNSKFSV